MKLRKLTFAIVLLALPAVLAFAQGQRRADRAREYDPTKEVTVKGTVVEVESIAEGSRWSPGMHLTLKTESGDYEVRLGPARFMESQKIQLAKGDQIEVVGAKSGAKAIIARQVKKGDKVLELRDEHGIPAWSRGPRTTS